MIIRTKRRKKSDKPDRPERIHRDCRGYPIDTGVQVRLRRDYTRLDGTRYVAGEVFTVHRTDKRDLSACSVRDRDGFRFQLACCKVELYWPQLDA